MLEAMGAAGRSCIRVGCRGGGCGICRVRVLSGNFRSGVISREQLSAEQQADGYALACKLYPLSDLNLQVVTAPATATAVSLRSLWLGSANPASGRPSA